MLLDITDLSQSTDIKKDSLLTEENLIEFDHHDIENEPRTNIQDDFENSQEPLLYEGSDSSLSYSLSEICISPPQIVEEKLDHETLQVLQSSGCLNWWTDFNSCATLRVLKTTGDGNCLLHATSLAMSHVEDIEYKLRSSLQSFLLNDEHKVKLYGIWRKQQEEFNSENHINFSEEDWTNEWIGIENLTSSNGSMKYLEQFHVFALAQLIKRPIIVYANKMIYDVNGIPIDAIPFGGIYLPIFATEDGLKFDKTPVLLAYNNYHFSALVANTNCMSIRIPLVDNRCEPLPVHYVDTSQSCLQLNEFLKITFDENVAWKILCCDFD